MSRTDELPADQRAALSLLLRQRTSYAQLAGLLGISERAVHDRAQAALAVLAPREARGLPSQRREQIGDYLLGQQNTVPERLATRTYLNSSEPARAWAAAIVRELTPLASVPLPEIPAGADAGDLAERAASPLVGSASASASPRRTSPPSSRLGGALLLGVIVAAVVVAVVLLTGGGGSSSHTNTSATTTRANTTTGPAVDARLVLKPPDPRSRSIGGIDVLSEGSKRAFYIEAEHLPPSRGFFYALWLYNSPHSFRPLSKSPPVGSNGRLAGGALLPAEAADYHEIRLTRETSTHPTHPGPVVLRGPFSVGG